MSVQVSMPQLFADVGSWGFCYLVTVSDGGRPHVIALRPDVVGDADDRRLRLDAGGGRACRNADQRSEVTLVFPPHATSEGMSLIVDGRAAVSDGHVTVSPTSAVLHRPAP